LATPQPGIFDEGHDHHYFLEFELRGEIDIKALRDALRASGAQASVSTDPDVVLAFGPRAWQAVAPDDMPDGFHEFETIRGMAGRQAPATQRDLLVWIHGTGGDRCFERALEVGRSLGGLATPSVDMPGFRFRDSRDLTGFVDGTANPYGQEARDAALVSDGPGAGGSFVLSQKWVHDLAQWSGLSDAAQEKVVGRTKPDSIELTGDDMPPDSHVSRTDVKVDGVSMKIWRRSVPYGTVREHGLYFLAFARSLERFQVQLDRMFGVSEDGLHDRLVEYTVPVTGSYWFAPPVELLATALA